MVFFVIILVLLVVVGVFAAVTISWSLRLMAAGCG
jgi:hypothetical protein